MEDPLHGHSYTKTPCMELPNVETMCRYWEEFSPPTTVAGWALRAQLETEIAFHPQAEGSIQKHFMGLRLASDQELTQRHIPFGDVNSLLTHAFAPMVLDTENDSQRSRKLTEKRIKHLLNLCENLYPREPKVALGLGSEIFFNLAMNRGNTAAAPSRRREDNGSVVDGKWYAWDSLVVSVGHPPLKAGIYRAQVKHASHIKKYHPDIVTVYANPHDEYRVPEHAFFDFARLLLEGTPASQRDVTRLEGRIHTIHKSLRNHGPSLLKKVTDTCIYKAA